MVNRRLAESVVGFLRLSGETYDPRQLMRFSHRDWERTVTWLDRAGLTLYLLERLRLCQAAEVLPSGIVARFEHNLADNQLRVNSIAAETDRLNQSLNRADVRYVVIKGLSLWPSFCTNPYLRTQCDLDYLVAADSLSSAQSVLEESGYETRCRSKAQIQLEKPRQRLPSRGDNQYKIQTLPMVELHVDIWDDSVHRVSLTGPEFTLDSSLVRDWNGFRLPVLSDADAFLVQVLHAFGHVLSDWMRLSWLLEIGYFLLQRRQDEIFWGNLDERLRQVPRVMEFVAVVIELVVKIFSAPVPEVVSRWRQFLRPAALLWINHYGRSWAFADNPQHESTFFPGSKLSLLLQQEYIPGTRAKWELVQHRLIPWKKLLANVATNKEQPRPHVQEYWRQHTHMLLFHTGASLRYVWELRRWQDLKRVYPDLCRADMAS